MNIIRDARLSGEAVPLFRYTLTRQWDQGAYTLPIIMLNPSTADHTVDDPTIQTCMKFARRDGFGGIHVCNLLALRTPHPKELDARSAWGGEINGPENDDTLRSLFDNARGRDIWVAWGNGGLSYPARIQLVFDLAVEFDVRLIHLGLTMHGEPKHPLARGKHRILADQPFITLAGVR